MNSFSFWQNYSFNVNVGRKCKEFHLSGSCCSCAVRTVSILHLRLCDFLERDREDKFTCSYLHVFGRAAAELISRF